MTRADDRDRDILVMWDDGASVAAIADALGIGVTHVAAVTAELGERVDHIPLARWITDEVWEGQAA